MPQATFAMQNFLIALLVVIGLSAVSLIGYLLHEYLPPETPPKIEANAP
jgi:hypothetical protein